MRAVRGGTVCFAHSRARRWSAGNNVVTLRFLAALRLVVNIGGHPGDIVQRLEGVVLCCEGCAVF